MTKLELAKCARNYRVRMNTKKVRAFYYFEKGFEPEQVRYLIDSPYQVAFNYYKDWLRRKEKLGVKREANAR